MTKRILGVVSQQSVACALLTSVLAGCVSAPAKPGAAADRPEASVHPENGSVAGKTDADVGGAGEPGSGTTTKASTPALADTAESPGSDIGGAISPKGTDGQGDSVQEPDGGNSAAASPQVASGAPNNTARPLVGSLTPKVVGVSVARGLACQVDEEGGVQCWGDNSQGQLGDKTVTARSEKPVSVKGLAGSATAVGVAPNFACALLEGGTVQCWGDNTGGKLGSGSTNTPAYVPEYVQGLEGVVSLAVSNTHVCAVLGDGTVQCWGSNAWGQLGVGSTTPSSSSVPLEVIGISEATQVTAASGPYSGTCALLKGGTVKCWGYNVSGQFGSAAIGTVSVPVTIQGLVDVIEVSLGQTQVCAVSSDGDVHCAGSNAKGQLGDGSNVSSAIPVKVVGFGKATHISTASSDGYGYACAIADGGKVSCWGSNVYKTLGDGTTQNSKIPILVADTGIGDVVALSAGETSVCAVRKKGIVQCWGTQ